MQFKIVQQLQFNVLICLWKQSYSVGYYVYLCGKAELLANVRLNQFWVWEYYGSMDTVKWKEKLSFYLK